MRSRRFILGSTVAISTAALLAATGGAVAHADDNLAPNSTSAKYELLPEPNFHIESDGTVVYEDTAAKIGAVAKSSEVIQGQKTNTLTGESTCQFSSSSHGVGSQGVDLTLSLDAETRFNPANCTQEIKHYRLTQREASAAGLLKGATGDVEQGSDPAADTSPSLAGTTWGAWIRTKWVDPINIDISSQYSGLKWTSRGWSSWKTGRDSFQGCVRGYCLDRTYVTFKNQDVHNLADRARFNVRTDFQNDSFGKWVLVVARLGGWAACGFPRDMSAYFHHRVTTDGRYNGKFVHGWKDSKSGACTNLVHHETPIGGWW